MGVREEMVNLAHAVGHDPKPAGGAFAAILAGTSTALELISPFVGFAASVAGLFLALALLKKARLETRILQRRLRELNEPLEKPKNPPRER